MCHALFQQKMLMQEIHNSRDNAVLLPCGHYLHHTCYAGLLENG